MNKKYHNALKAASDREARERIKAVYEKLTAQDEGGIGKAVSDFVLPEAGAAEVEDKRTTLGMKNNNPGNLKGYEQGWKGSTGKDKYGHVQFASMDDGIRANYKNLVNHARKNPDETLIHYLQSSYAEANGAAEARYIEKHSGISVNEKLKNIDWTVAAPHLWKIESKIHITPERIKAALSRKA